MPNIRRAHYIRAAVAAVTACCALTLTGCGNDSVIHNGSDGVSFSGGSATAADLQTASVQITQALGQGTITPGDVATVLALGPAAVKLGQQHDVAVSETQIQSAYPAVKFNQTALQALQSNDLLSQLQTADPTGVATLLKTAQVTLNPRYGTWVAGQGAVAASEPWIKSTPSSSAPAVEQNGHPAS